MPSGRIVLAHQRRQVGFFQRGAEEPALHHVAADPRQKRRLLHGLHPFGDGRQAQRVRQLHDGTDDGFGVGVASDIHNKRAIDFQAGKAKPPQIGQRRVAGAEIVDRHRKTRLHQRAQGLPRDLGLASRDRLGDLRLQPARRHTLKLGQLAQALGKLGPAQLQHRHVDRHVRSARPFGPPAHRSQRLAQHPVPDFDDAAGTLGHRDELRRRDRSPLRMLPAQQRLGSDDAAIPQTELRLVQQPQLTARHRLRQRAGQLAQAIGAMLQLGSVKTQRVARRLFGLVQGCVSTPQQLIRIVPIVRGNSAMPIVAPNPISTPWI